NEAAARKTAEEKEQQWREQKEEADRRREEARRNLYVAQMNLVQREYEANNIGQARDLLDNWKVVPPEVKDLRGFEWYYWQRLTHSEYLTLQGHTKDLTSVAFSPEGRRLVTSSLDNTIKVWDTATGRELLTLQGHTEQVGRMVYSPDGARLASVSGETEKKIS